MLPRLTFYWYALLVEVGTQYLATLHRSLMRANEFIYVTHISLKRSIYNMGTVLTDNEEAISLHFSKDFSQPDPIDEECRSVCLEIVLFRFLS